MTQYQVLARRYRPQTFGEVIGQEAIVTTLKNGIKNSRLAHAYLFCGSRGTGKTTLARLFAKALNCLQPTADHEPCNQCSSCKEITSGHSLDVLEIDGASHRGIDDVRQINETVGYATSTGGYKIYIIDEVHMLTKEAFNALLKTLEEPPAKVIFFFATTEPHKVLPTILSRCQRFNLNRIPFEKIVAKLKEICQDLKVDYAEEALHLIASRAEGGLRDAESLLDQMISFQNGAISLETVTSILGIMGKEAFFTLDQAGKEGNLAIAFEIAHQIFSQGKDLIHFVESLTEHFRTLLMIKMGGKTAQFLTLSEAEKEKYETSAKIYTQNQCLTIIDLLMEAQQQIRFTPNGRIAIEALLLKILRIHQRLPVEYLVKRLTEIEQSLSTSSNPSTTLASSPPPLPPKAEVVEMRFEKPKPAPAPTPTPKPAPATSKAEPSITIDPTPSSADLGIKSVKKNSRTLKPEEQSRYDTILNFAAVELEGTIKKVN